MSDSMGVFGAATRKKRNTPFEPGIPVSRGGGRHMMFNRVKIIPGTQNFMAVQLQPYPGAPTADIRPMGPYELPAYSETHSSAEGIGQIPGIPGATPAAGGGMPAIPGLTPAAPGAEEPWYKKIASAIPQIYQAYEATKKKPTPPPPVMPPQAFVYSGDQGMSTTMIVLLVGGGVVALGLVGFLLLRK